MTSSSPSEPTAIAERLGIGPGARVALLHAPDGIEPALGASPAGATVQHGLRRTDTVDVILGFVTEEAHLARNLGWLVATLAPGGAFWVAWPQPSSGMATDLTEEVIRGVARPHGWDGAEVQPIDEVWSALGLHDVGDPTLGA